MQCLLSVRPSHQHSHRDSRDSKQHQDCNQSNIINVAVDFKFIGSSRVFFALACLSSHAVMFVVCSGHYEHTSSGEQDCVETGQSSGSENIVYYSAAGAFVSVRITH
jgi:hypothetical protein